MCNICAADLALENTKKGSHARFEHRESESAPLLVEAIGEASTNTPATFRFKRLNDIDWTKWLNTNDLAFTMGSLGTDVSWGYVSGEVREYLEGGPVEPLLARISAEVLESPQMKPARTLRSIARARAKQRLEYRKKRMAKFAPYFPGWTASNVYFKLGDWRVQVMPWWATRERKKPLNTRVFVKGPLTFDAKFSDALAILRQYGLAV